MEKGIQNWSESVEDLVDAGDVESAISLLESVAETLNPSDSASALSDLANLYSSRGFSLKADHLLSRASVLKQLHHSNSPYSSLSLSVSFIVVFLFESWIYDFQFLSVVNKFRKSRRRTEPSNQPVLLRVVLLKEVLKSVRRSFLLRPPLAVVVPMKVLYVFLIVGDSSLTGLK